ITQGLADSLGEDSLGREITVNLMVEGVATVSKFIVSGIYASDAVIGPTAAFDSLYMNFSDLVKISEENNINLQPNIVYLVSEDTATSTLVKETAEKMGYRGSAMESIATMFTEMIDIFTYILTGVAALSLFVSAIMILTVLYISVVERTQEIGVI